MASDFCVSSRAAASENEGRSCETAALAVRGCAPAHPRTKASTASTAPLRMQAPSTSTPEMRVWAENAENAVKRALIAAMSRPRMPYFSFARTSIERPSGVSSDSDASCAASVSSVSLTPLSGMNSAACRLPRVIVPVLSSRSVSTSLAASTERPDIASTLSRTSRSIPAMPMADSSAPIVVGISATNSATRITTETEPPA
jgi:hypothetical protein